MNEQQINNRLNELSKIADKRKQGTDITYLPDHTATIYFLTEEEQKERHELILQLPSTGEKVQQAKKRIKERTKLRNTMQQLKKEAQQTCSPDYYYDVMDNLDDMADIDLMIFIISNGDPDKEQQWLQKFEAEGTEKYEQEIRRKYAEYKNKLD